MYTKQSVFLKTFFFFFIFLVHSPILQVRRVDRDYAFSTLKILK